MIIHLPQSVIDFVNANTPELAAAGGLQSIEFEVVDSLPLPWVKRSAMSWDGRVYVRREWIQPALDDMDEGNTLKAKYVWALEILAFHEWFHVLLQRRGWYWYAIKYSCLMVIPALGRYFAHPEEKAAYAETDRLLALWQEGPMRDYPGWELVRPQT